MRFVQQGKLSLNFLLILLAKIKFNASISYLDSRVLLLGSVDGDFEVVVVADVAVFDGDWDLDALSDGFDCCRFCCCC